MNKVSHDATISVSGTKSEPLAYPDRFAEAVRKIYADDDVSNRNDFGANKSRTITTGSKQKQNA